MDQKISWEEFAATGEAHLRDARYREAAIELARASELAREQLRGTTQAAIFGDPTAIAQARTTAHSVFAKRQSPEELKDWKREFTVLSGLARILGLLGSARHHLGEADAADEAFQHDFAVIAYLIENYISDAIGNFQEYLDRFLEHQRPQLAKEVQDRASAKVMTILG